VTRTGFVIANLFRRKARTTLTLLSVTSAFLLFGLIQAVLVLFDRPADFIGITRLITQARVSFTQPLAIRLLPQIESVPGVARVAWILFFGGTVGDNTPVFALAADPLRLRDVSPQWVMPDEQWQAFGRSRTGMIAGRLIAQKYGWKIGDRIPIKKSLVPQHNGSRDWAFDLVGIFDGRDEQSQKATLRLYVNYAYVDEANALGSGNVNFFVLRLTDAAVAEQVAQAVDAKFENSTDETKTQTETDFVVSFVRQIGDIGLIARWIMFAVFFTLLLVVGNTMAQAVRERIPELAVLKTIGFSNRSVLWLVLAESIFLIVLGGLIGLALAALLMPLVSAASGGTIQLPTVLPQTWGVGLVLMLAIGVIVGLLPALRAMRLKIVDALAGR
jgi:putative ABC transport system permease protein